jgi:hypothetical protein
MLIKSRGMSEAVHVACTGDMINAHKILALKAEERAHLRNLRMAERVILKLILKQ